MSLCVCRLTVSVRLTATERPGEEDVRLARPRARFISCEKTPTRLSLWRLRFPKLRWNQNVAVVFGCLEKCDLYGGFVCVRFRSGLVFIVIIHWPDNLGWGFTFKVFFRTVEFMLEILCFNFFIKVLGNWCLNGF